MADPHASPLVPTLAPGDPTSGDAAGLHGVVAAVGHDLATVSALVDRQLAMPLRPDGLIAMLTMIVAGLLIAGLLPVATIRANARLVKRHPDSGALAPLCEAIVTLVVICAGIGFGTMLLVTGVETGLTLLPIAHALGETMVAGAFVAGLGVGVGFAIAAVDDPENRPFDIVADDWIYRSYCSAFGIMLAVSGLVEETSRLIHAAAPTRGLAHGVVLLVEAALIVGFLIRIGASLDRGRAAGARRRRRAWGSPPPPGRR